MKVLVFMHDKLRTHLGNMHTRLCVYNCCNAYKDFGNERRLVERSEDDEEKPRGQNSNG